MKTLFSFVLAAVVCTLASGQGSMCLQSPPGLPGGNGQNGTMFDIQATGGAVVIQDFRQAAFTAGTTATYEVYVVTGGGTFVGNETNAGAWTLLATSAPVTHTGPGVADTLGLNLGYVIGAGQTQGFYVTSLASTVSYTNGVGTPGTTIVASDSLISVTEGVGKSYPFGSTFTPRNNNMEVCYDPGMGLFANFTGTPTSGAAPLTVAFTDTSFTSDPLGIVAWAWDFGDGGTSSMQNPSHTYVCPGSYDVTLTVLDTLNPQNTIVKTGFVTVSGPLFDLSTTGAGDLTITPVDTSCYPNAVTGYTLASLSGPGPFLGITPDSFTLSLITIPAAPGVVPHFVVTPTTYPNVPRVFPPGALASLSGQSITAVQVLLDAAGNLVFVSNADTVTL